MSGIEPDLRPSQGRVRIHYTSQTFLFSGAGGIRTHKHLLLKQAASRWRTTPDEVRSWKFEA